MIPVQYLLYMKVSSEFCRLNPFEIIERGTENVGYTVIKRK